MRREAVVIGLIALALFFTGCSEPQEKTLEKIRVNVCSCDPNNADYWRSSGINLFKEPGSLTRAGTIPACDNVVVEVLEKKTYNGREFYKVKYGGIEGWATKLVLTCQE